jgi:hypothetical protein
MAEECGNSGKKRIRVGRYLERLVPIVCECKIVLYLQSAEGSATTRLTVDGERFGERFGAEVLLPQPPTAKE